MTYEFWKKTGQIRPFSSVEEFEQFEKDLCKLPSLESFVNTPLHKSKIKKGVNLLSEKFDSFAEYTFVTYMRLVKLYIVERNKKMAFLTYVDLSGKVCKFYPDFIVNGVFYEVKGRLTEKDMCKLQQCPEVIWQFQSDINQMAAELNSLYPHWATEFIQTN